VQQGYGTGTSCPLLPPNFNRPNLKQVMQNQKGPLLRKLPTQNMVYFTLEDVAEGIKEGYLKNIVIVTGAGVSTSAG
jgi:hypothetical protein